MLQSMRDKYPDSKIKIVAIFPGGSSNEMIRKVYHDRWGIKNIPAFVDPKMKLFDAFDISGVPFSVVIDKNGRPGESFLGMADKKSMERAFDKVIGR